MGVRDGLGSTAHTELAVERGQTVLQSSGHDPELLGDLRNGLRRVDREQQRLLGRGQFGAEGGLDPQGLGQVEQPPLQLGRRHPAGV